MCCSFSSFFTQFHSVFHIYIYEISKYSPQFLLPNVSTDKTKIDSMLPNIVSMYDTHTSSYKHLTSKQQWWWMKNLTLSFFWKKKYDSFFIWSRERLFYMWELADAIDDDVVGNHFRFPDFFWLSVIQQCHFLIRIGVCTPCFI